MPGPVDIDGKTGEWEQPQSLSHRLEGKIGYKWTGQCRITKCDNALKTKRRAWREQSECQRDLSSPRRFRVWSSSWGLREIKQLVRVVGGSGRDSQAEEAAQTPWREGLWHLQGAESTWVAGAWKMRRAWSRLWLGGGQGTDIHGSLQDRWRLWFLA